MRVASEVRTIRSFPNYGASADGRVYRRRGEAWRELRQFKLPTGYRQVYLYRDGRRFNVYVHRAVMEAFPGDIPDGHEVHHLDRRRGRNDLGNLVLVDRSHHARIHRYESRADAAVTGGRESGKDEQD